jgi:hypothetical protein
MFTPRRAVARAVDEADLAVVQGTPGDGYAAVAAPRRVGGERGDGGGRLGEARGDGAVARAPLRQAVELPDAEAHADAGDDEGEKEERAGAGRHGARKLSARRARTRRALTRGAQNPCCTRAVTARSARAPGPRTRV